MYKKSFIFCESVKHVKQNKNHKFGLNNTSLPLKITCKIEADSMPTDKKPLKNNNYILIPHSSF